ncbi:diguanylate cyclase [Alicyclobacillus dauci]|uniref:Diguanylate cyclase n=1 Tax=Alicyclobacillus dauci TaxID=1475485 RepID=A0ABY6Z8S8_9BACL|nr:diguanylate cyclase [Alicyclobacillus dauci]WAH39133.1 diguanylate cyclase [Alicyclobacillus dauci]
MVLRDFFINFCILCTGIFLLYLLFRKIRHRVNSSSVSFKLATGLAQGLFGVLLMQFGIQFSKTVLIDLRSIPIMIAAQVGGPIPSIVAAVVITVFRFASYPYSTSALVNAAIVLIAGVSFGWVARASIRRQHKWWTMAAIFSVLLGLGIHIVIPGWKAAGEIYVQYVFSIVMATYFTRFLVSYLWRSQDALDQLKEVSRKDFLTGLKNTRAFNEEMNRIYDQAKAQREPLSLLIIDIDYFKQINDTYGHPAGDEVLKQVGDVFLRACRSVDIVCRNGGEEFSVILPVCDQIRAKQVAERIRSAVETNIFVVNNDKPIRLTVSMGISTVTAFHSTSIDRITQFADEGLYMAKQSGRNRVCLKEAL